VAAAVIMMRPCELGRRFRPLHSVWSRRPSALGGTPRTGDPYPYAYGYYDYIPATGAVKFDTGVKNAEVYIDGAYAGTVRKTEDHESAARHL